MAIAQKREYAPSDIMLLLDRPIAFHRVFVDLAGSVTAALLLSQAVYWSNRTSDPAGWFYKTQKDWEEETGLTRREQESARAKLRAVAILEEKKEGIPAKLFFRINSSALCAALSSLHSPACTNPPSLPARFAPPCPTEEPGNGSSFRQPLSTIPPVPIRNLSEISAENTAKTTGREIPPPRAADSIPAPVSLSSTDDSARASFPLAGIPVSLRDSQRNRFSSWARENWAEIQQKYLPYFGGNVGLLRYSLEKCFVWAHDNAGKAAKCSDPGQRIRQWLDEEDVERLLRAIKGQGRVAGDASPSPSASQGNGPAARTSSSAVGQDAASLVPEYKKIFSIFQNFAREMLDVSLSDGDWNRLEQDIMARPQKYLEQGEPGFPVLYDFFGIQDAALSP